MFKSLEKSSAYIAFSLAVFTVLTKIPSLTRSSLSQNKLFITVDADYVIDYEIGPQYPRREPDEYFWNMFYFLIYGCLGSVAQYGSIKISSGNVSSRDNLMAWSSLYACFHLIIGIHHFIWSVKSDYGKLQLWIFNLPLAYELSALSALACIYHAYRIRTCNGDLKDICHRKAVLDTVVVCTFISVFGFVFANAVGMQVSYQMSRFLWAITFYSMVAVITYGFK